MLTFNTLSAFKPQLKLNGKNAVTNPTMNKNIRFGESDCDGDYFVPSNRRWKIENDYDKQLDSLADLADDIDMDNDIYYSRKREIEKERDIALRDYDNTHDES